MELRKQMQITM